MALTIVLVLIGLGLGASIWGHAGWLPGGLIGFLSGYLIQLTERVKALEQRLDRQQAGAPEPPASAVPRRAPAEPPSTRILPAQEPARAAPSRVASTPRAAQTPRATQSAALKSPTLLDHALRRILSFFTEGNPIVRLGMLVLFFGLSFLVKYASSRGVFPIELRLALTAVMSIVLVVIGWRTRDKQNGYGLVLQGGGIAALYLTVFAATKIFPLLSSSLAFGLMFVIVMVGAALAVLQNAQVLALTATAGGFLAPILTSDGSGNHVALFSFYLLLNTGILAIAWFKAWRLLNWVGFVFTFVISTAWGVADYEPRLYASTQPFLLAFFALYLGVSVLFSFKQPPKLTGLVDGSLVFGLPVVGFGLQAALLKHTEMGLAISAVVLAALYIGLARILWGRHRDTHRLMIESFIALGLTFATLAVPLALDAAWTSATWALEAAGLVWVGARQSRLLPRFAGYLLYVAAVASFFAKDWVEVGEMPIISGDFIGMVILSVAALGIAYVLKGARGRLTRFEGIEGPAIAIGAFWWLFAGVVEIVNHVREAHHYAAVMLFLAASLYGLAQLGRKLAWNLLCRCGYAIAPLMALWVIPSFAWMLVVRDSLHPFDGFGAIAIAGFAAFNYRFLWQRQSSPHPGLLNTLHFFTAVVLLLQIYWEVLWWHRELQLSATAGLLLAFACFALPLPLLMTANKRERWPFAQHRFAYRDLIPLPLMVLLALWFVTACGYAGATDRLHLPVLNPLDLAQLAAVLVFAYCIRNGLARLGSAGPELRFGLPGLAVFIWANVVVLRAVHHYTDVVYRTDALWDSAFVQMGLSILWASCALLVMTLSQRKQERSLWIIGALLLGLVVLKLFTKDLTDSGTLARVISFMGAGVLMLLIGYLSPMPGKGRQNAPREEATQ